MHIVVEQNSFKEAVNLVARTVSTRSPIPVLTGIKLDVDQDNHTLTGSDSDLTIQVSIPAQENDKELIKVVRMGSIVLPARYFAEIIRRAPVEQVELELLENQVVKIRAGSAHFDLNGLDAEEYPPLPALDNEQMFRISSPLLRAMIRQTSFAAATSESRPQLTGVLFKLDNGTLTLVATDSHRLARRSAQVEPVRAASFDQVIVPSRSLNELHRLLDGEEGMVDVVVANHQIMVKAGHLLFYSRLLEGTYPDTERIIPTSYKTALAIGTQGLIDALERASLLARDGKHVVKLNQREEGLEMTSQAPEVGQVVEQIRPDRCEGEEIQIAFNAKFVIDALKAVETEQVEIRFTGTLSPFMIKPVGEETMLHLIVPVRT